MAPRPTLAEFVDQELRLAEPVFVAVVDEVLKQWRERSTMRMADELDAVRVLHQQRGDFIRNAWHALYELAYGKPDRPATPASKTGRLELALLDDDDVTADIEIARLVERSNAELEEPLRELRTYTSALVGDVNAARDTNPLRPEVWVRAVLTAARGLPIARRMQVNVLRAGTVPLIRALGEHYIAACARLQASGVTPATHRTVVNEGVVTELTDAMRARRSLSRDDRSADHDPSVYVPASSARGPVPREPHSTTDHAGARLYARVNDIHGADPWATAQSASAPLPHTGERVSRLYDAILGDRRLPRESLPLLSRLYPSVLRHTLADPAVLDDASHAIWTFVDHLAFLMQTREVGDRQVNITLAHSLVEQLATQPGIDARPFRSAANRLAVLERQRFARAVAAASSDIALLATQDKRLGDTPSVPQSLDGGATDSQPVPLLRRGGDEEPVRDEVIGAWRAGSWLTLFLRGQWRRALVLWRGPAHGPLLLLDASEARHWALRDAAIGRLAHAGLVRVFAPRSLMGDAAGRLDQVSREPGPTLFG
jgi:Protein of unknown function (DUF1631)